MERASVVEAGKTVGRHRFGEPIIELSDVCKSFGDNHVLRGVSLSVRCGETMVVMGTSGCGKSVLLQLLVGLLTAEAGTIVIDGEEVTRFSSDEQWDKVRLKIGFLFQGGALYDSMTVWENVAFALLHHTNLAPTEVDKRVKDKLSMVHLEDIEDKFPAELSGGMQKRVALARAIAMDPEIVFYDEPTTGLDPVHSRWISHLIRHLQRQLSVTSIVVTHDRDLIFQVADRVAMLNEGLIVDVGTVQEIRSSSNPYLRQFLEGSIDGPIK